MGYILLPPSLIENRYVKNWHLFHAERDIDRIHLIKKTSECNSEILSKNSIIEKTIKEKFNYYLLCNKDYFKLNRIGSGYYHTNADHSFYYSDDENIIKMLASILEKQVCAKCISQLYGDLDAKNN